VLIQDPKELRGLEGEVTPRDILMSRDFSIDNDVTLVTKDCLKFMPAIPNESATLVLTSPPYNIGKEYESRLTLLEYRKMLADVIAESVRILRPGGSICFQVGSYMAGPGRPKPLAFLVDPLFEAHEETTGVVMRNTIVWHFEHGYHASNRFSGRHEMILWYTKGDDYVFNLDDVRVPQKYPGKRHFKGPKKGQYSGNPLGKNPGDVWTDIPNVKANHIEKTDHPCQFPVGLAKRIIIALTNPGDLVVDPFSGVGTTVVAAVLTSRRAAGADLVADYVNVARDRVREAAAGTLRFRDDRPVYVPSTTDAVARFPEGFWPNPGDDGALDGIHAGQI
jgi:adenine-specific DNA-methyltransferase